jgi:hypothetical protein
MSELYPSGTGTAFSVDIPARDLRSAGWHHASECPARIPAFPLPLGDALAELHQQAHPGQPADPYACNQEPCCRLSLAQITGRSAA